MGSPQLDRILFGADQRVFIASQALEALKIIVIRQRLGMLQRQVLFAGQHGEKADRKSTRLNSSHSQISYAVFCLKKKTTNASSSRRTPRRRRASRPMRPIYTKA